MESLVQQALQAHTVEQNRLSAENAAEAKLMSEATTAFLAEFGPVVNAALGKMLSTDAPEAQWSALPGGRGIKHRKETNGGYTVFADELTATLEGVRINVSVVPGPPGASSGELHFYVVTSKADERGARKFESMAELGALIQANYPQASKPPIA